MEIILDICTPEGKTWLARITGPDERWGVARKFLRPVSRSTSRSGKTGSVTYEAGPGVYERREGRNRLHGDNGFFRITADETIVNLASAAAALKALEGTGD